MRGEAVEPPNPETQTGEETPSPANRQGDEPTPGAAEPTSDVTAEQPWLQADEREEVAPPVEQTDSPPRRLVANVQGLLDPVRVFSEATDESEAAATGAEMAPVVQLGADQLRRYRVLMGEDPLLEERQRTLALPNMPALRLPLIFLLVGALVLLGFVLPPTAGRQLVVQPWPGVHEAVEAIHALAPGSPILLLWGYDPATAGEMDLLALPLATHLAAQQSRPLVVSLLPNGLATARRLFAQVAASEIEARQLQLAVGEAQMASSVFLPGGAALPLLGQDAAAVWSGGMEVGAAGLTETAEVAPVLAVIVAAQAEDVIDWLEQTQPLDRLPVVAFTSAAADPILRPYLESGQLRGLVSGFDGAWAYAQQSGLPLNAANQARLDSQLTRQTWGHLALLLAIVLGNLAAFVGREHHG
ncbi:MAG TPA: hypothetical protein PKE45_05265 [Caldilineaceae bacterium]|nr:hypothetical protein [Caldilineaceae bacterium]